MEDRHWVREREKRRDRMRGKEEDTHTPRGGSSANRRAHADRQSLATARSPPTWKLAMGGGIEMPFLSEAGVDPVVVHGAEIKVSGVRESINHSSMGRP